MPGTRREFENAIEAAIHANDSLPAEVRAAVLTQHANQLRAADDTGSGDAPGRPEHGDDR